MRDDVLHPIFFYEDHIEIVYEGKRVPSHRCVSIEKNTVGTRCLVQLLRQEGLHTRGETGDGFTRQTTWYFVQDSQQTYRLGSSSER